MKQSTTFIKIMFGCSVISVILFSAFYIWGINEVSKDYKLDDMRIIAGTKANIERREIKRKKQQIDKQKVIKAEGKITAQTSMFED